MMRKKNKTVLSALTALILCATMLFSSTGASFATVSEKGLIGLSKAKQIALKDAKLKEADVVFVQAKLDREDGRAVYEIEFYRKGKEYDYEIHAKSGKILSRDFDIENYSAEDSAKKPSQNAATDSAAVKVTSPKKTKNTGSIDAEKAKQIALAHAQLKAEEVLFEKVQRDVEDGVRVYELSFYVPGFEFEYEIDAVTGKVRSWSVEEENDWDD